MCLCILKTILIIIAVIIKQEKSSWKLGSNNYHSNKLQYIIYKYYIYTGAIKIIFSEFFQPNYIINILICNICIVHIPFVNGWFSVGL